MPQLHCIGGEQDGLIVTNCSMDRPDVYYVPPLAAEKRIKAVRGKLKRKELSDSLSTLAYKFWRVVSKQGIGLEFQFVRDQSLDKKVEDTVGSEGPTKE